MGLARTEVEGAIGATTGQLYRWERGTSMPSGAALVRAMHLLDIAPAEMVATMEDAEPRSAAGTLAAAITAAAERAAAARGQLPHRADPR